MHYDGMFPEIALCDRH